MNENTDRARWIAQWVYQYRGYESGEDRRRSDSAFREYVLRRLDWYAKRLAEVAASPPAVPEVGPFVVSVKRFCSRLQDLVDQLSAVPYSYGEFMIVPNIAPADLEEFYRRDEEVLHRIAEIQSLIDPTITEKTNASRLANDLGVMVDSLSEAIDARQTKINEFAPDPRITGYF